MVTELGLTAVFDGDVWRCRTDKRTLRIHARKSAIVGSGHVDVELLTDDRGAPIGHRDDAAGTWVLRLGDLLTDWEPAGPDG